MLLDSILQGEFVEGGYEGENELRVNIADMFPDEEDSSAKLSSDRDCVLRVIHYLFFALPWCDEIFINCTTLNGLEELEEVKGSLQCLILEGRNLEFAFDS